MISGDIEKIGFFLLVLIEMIIYYHLVVKPKILKIMQENFVSQKIYETQYIYLKESLEEIKADIKQLVKNS